MMVLLVAVAAVAFWAGRNSRSDPHAEGWTTRREIVDRPAPVWPWVAGAAALGALLLGLVAGPSGVFAGLMGP